MPAERTLLELWIVVARMFKGNDATGGWRRISRLADPGEAERLIGEAAGVLRPEDTSQPRFAC
jgi:hypothetical protein